MSNGTLEQRYQDNINFLLLINNDMISVNDNVKYTSEHVRFENINFDKIKFIDAKCKYNNNLELDINRIFSDSKKITFKNCIFMESLNFTGNIDRTLIFKDCKFKSISLNHRQKTKNKHSIYFSISKDTKYIDYFIERLSIHNCEFDKKFYINNQKDSNQEVKIKSIIIKEVTFHNNFKLHRCKIDSMKIEGIDFEKNADFFNSTFKQNEEIIFHSVNVKGITIFEECIFCKKFTIRYATLSGLVQFRSAKFCEGFNMDKTNIEKEVNFFAVEGLENNSKLNDTSQETYRILKHNCEKIGNMIDANNYHKLELEKRREDLKYSKRYFFDRLMLNLNAFSSNFGTNYIRPLLGILFIGFITLLMLHYPRIGDLFNTNYLINTSVLLSGIDKAFEYMYILNKDSSFTEYGFIFLLNKIFLGYLYYQFIIAVRKDTRK